MPGRTASSTLPEAMMCASFECRGRPAPVEHTLMKLIPRISFLHPF